jgi:predicted transposase YbfD/YdcC
MKCTMLPLDVQLPQEPFAFSLQALVEKLHSVQDLRDPRGVRYPLSVVLTVAVLAKLAGHGQLRAVAEWAGLRSEQLCSLLGFGRTTLPHPTTWGRIFGTALDPCALDQVVGEFFKELCSPLIHKKRRRRGGLVLTMDGKTLRGTIPLGCTKGVHLVCAYLPQVGVVVAQLQVEEKANELTVAPTLLAQLDLEGVVVTGDAMFAQRNLSAQIVMGGGDYLWKVKENQPELLADIRTLFEPPPALQPTKSEAPNFALPSDLEWASSLNKGHGRVEERTIWVSSALCGYSDWPHLAQVFKLKCRVVDGLGQVKEMVHYGVTSLPRVAASPHMLLRVVRKHWGIENGLHYRRDVSLDEDYSQVRVGHAPRVLATLNNIVVGLAAHHGEANLPAAQRAFHYRLERALWTRFLS